MKIDPNKGVARSSHQVGMPRPRPEESDDESGDEGTVDETSSQKVRPTVGPHGEIVGYKAIKSERHDDPRRPGTNRGPHTRKLFLTIFLLLLRSFAACSTFIWDLDRTLPIFGKPRVPPRRRPSPTHFFPEKFHQLLGT